MFVTFYLPEHLHGKAVIVASASAGCYCIDNSELQADSEGLAYRNTKRLDDTEGFTAPWGAVVEGVLKDGWLQVQMAEGQIKRQWSVGSSATGSYCLAEAPANGEESGEEHEAEEEQVQTFVTVTRYLPRCIHGKATIFETKDAGWYSVDNCELQADTEGLAYRNTMELDDCEGIVAPWGAKVKGVLEDGWIGVELVMNRRGRICGGLQRIYVLGRNRCGCTTRGACGACLEKCGDCRQRVTFAEHVERREIPLSTVRVEKEERLEMRQLNQASVENAQWW